MGTGSHVAQMTRDELVRSEHKESQGGPRARCTPIPTWAMSTLLAALNEPDRPVGELVAESVFLTEGLPTSTSSCRSIRVKPAVR